MGRNSETTARIAARRALFGIGSDGSRAAMWLRPASCGS